MRYGIVEPSKTDVKRALETLIADAVLRAAAYVKEKNSDILQDILKEPKSFDQAKRLSDHLRLYADGMRALRTTTEVQKLMDSFCNSAAKEMLRVLKKGKS